jgi:hypothetical protein
MKLTDKEIGQAITAKERREQQDRTIQPNENHLRLFLHCRLCLQEVAALAKKKGSASPRDYARLSVGWTQLGLQVWCNRHDANVLHVDFEGFQHPGDTSRKTDH